MKKQYLTRLHLYDPPHNANEFVEWLQGHINAIPDQFRPGVMIDIDCLGDIEIRYRREESDAEQLARLLIKHPGAIDVVSAAHLCWDNPNDADDLIEIIKLESKLRKGKPKKPQVVTKGNKIYGS